MIVISHRGNLSGPVPKRENSPEYLLQAISAGYDVELDLWSVRGELFLGHEKEEYPCKEEFLTRNIHKLWVHCKNYEALDFCLNRGIRCFFHDKDDYTLTSTGEVWAYPTSKCNLGKTIIVDWGDFSGDAYGVCTDYPTKYFK